MCDSISAAKGHVRGTLPKMANNPVDKHCPHFRSKSLMSQEMAGQEGGPRRKVNVKQKRWQEDAERFPGSLPCPSEGGRVA